VAAALSAGACGAGPGCSPCAGGPETTRLTARCCGCTEAPELPRPDPAESTARTSAPQLAAPAALFHAPVATAPAATAPAATVVRVAMRLRCGPGVGPPIFRLTQSLLI